MTKKTNKTDIFITLPDRIIRELSIIDWVFNAQISKYNPDVFTYPLLLDSAGNGAQDGRFFLHIIVISEVKLFEIQIFKKHITERFENSIRSELLFDHLKMIMSHAMDIYDIYNKHLAPGSDVIKEYFRELNLLKDNNKHVEARILKSQHEAITFVDRNLFIDHIYFGNTNRNSPIYDRYNDSYCVFNYCDNFIFASYCKEIIDFINPLLRSDNKSVDGILETKEQKVRRILDSLCEIGSHGTVILSKENFEKLVTSYVKWIEKGELPIKADRFRFYGTNKEFFRSLNRLHSELNIKIKGIGELLTYHLLLNNQKGDNGEPMSPSTIEKNIKENK